MLGIKGKKKIREESNANCLINIIVKEKVVIKHKWCMFFRKSTRSNGRYCHKQILLEKYTHSCPHLFTHSSNKDAFCADTSKIVIHGERKNEQFCPWGWHNYNRRPIRKWWHSKCAKCFTNFINNVHCWWKVPNIGRHGEDQQSFAEGLNTG